MIRQFLMHSPQASSLASASQKSPRKRFRNLLQGLFAILMLAPVGCAAINLPLTWTQPKLKAVSLNWQVVPLPQPGAYRIAGNTDLPAQTRLTVLAIRYLYPVAAAARPLNPQPSYSILDYQSTVVERGSWQTQLNLWQVAANGRFLESWQLDRQRLAARFNPAQQVVFLVTLAPIDRLAVFQQLAAKGQTLPSQAIHSADGESYAQFHQVQAVPLPNGSTQANSQLKVENFGWGRRYLIPQEPQNPTQLERPTQPQTDAPIKPKEFLR